MDIAETGETIYIEPVVSPAPDERAPAPVEPEREPVRAPDEELVPA